MSQICDELRELYSEVSAVMSDPRLYVSRSRRPWDMFPYWYVGAKSILNTAHVWYSLRDSDVVSSSGPLRSRLDKKKVSTGEITDDMYDMDVVRSLTKQNPGKASFSGIIAH